MVEMRSNSIEVILELKWGRERDHLQYSVLSGRRRSQAEGEERRAAATKVKVKVKESGEQLWN